MSRPEQKSSVIVIGAGLGGLAAACTMAARGHKVTVLEANEWLGARLRNGGRVATGSIWGQQS